MKYYTEHRPTVKRMGAPKLICADEVNNYHGFRSMYLFPEELKNHIESTGSMAGLQTWSVSSDTLFVDFDDQPEAADQMIAAMQPYDFTAYHSGGRSIHLHVAIEPMTGSEVPYIQRSWMQKFYPLADHSIYKTAGIYRLPGTYHIKNPGKRKELIATNKTGKLLNIDKTELVDIKMPSYLYEDNIEDDKKWLDDLLCYPVYTGNQRNKANNIIYVAKRLGKTKEDVLDLMILWNRTNCKPPLNDYEIIDNIERKFGR